MIAEGLSHMKVEVTDLQSEDIRRMFESLTGAIQQLAAPPRTCELTIPDYLQAEVKEYLSEIVGEIKRYRDEPRQTVNKIEVDP